MRAHLATALALTCATAASCVNVSPAGTVFASEPPGARVHVDGRDSGWVTPCQIALDEEEQHVVRVALEGYVAREVVLTPQRRNLAVSWDDAVTGTRSTLHFPTRLPIGDFFFPFHKVDTLAPARVFVRLRARERAVNGASKPGGARGVFLDRDGTLVDELGFLRAPEDLRLIEGAAEGVRLFNEAGWRTIVVTNQSGLARGLLDERDLAAVHARLAAELAREGAKLDAIFHCPHHPDEGKPPLRKVCTCRKPAPGLLIEGAARLGVALPASWTIGDSLRDLEAGRRAGVAGEMLVLTGKGREELALAPGGAGLLTAPDLPSAARAILARAARSRAPST